MSIPSTSARRLAAGLALPFRAAAWLGQRPALWRHALVPVVLSLVGLLAGAVAAVPGSAALLAAVWQPPSGALAIAWYAARAVLFLVLVSLAAVALPLVLSGPFMDALSERVEAEELGAGPGRRGVRRVVSESVAGMVHALARVALFLLGHVLLLPALLVPGAWPVMAFLWTAWWTSVEWVSLPMARHLHRFSETRAALRRVRPTGFGLGCSLAAIFLLPLANLLLLPVGAVAGTLLYCDLVRSGVVERRA